MDLENLSDEELGQLDFESRESKQEQTQEPTEETNPSRETTEISGTAPEESFSQEVEDSTENSEPQEPTSTEPESVDAQQTASIDAEMARKFYKQVMAPLKANGKTIQLRSAEEAIQLMQMGANYTQKMQAIAPHRKILMTLEKNGLLDEAKINYLIDLDQKNPNAIKKLVKDANIDLYDTDFSEEQSYTPSNHSVSDKEMVFKSTLEDLRQTPSGQETINLIHNTWDQASIDELWERPAIMQGINQDRITGFYNQVVAEVERAKMFGSIPAEMPFLQAYVNMANRMSQQRQQANVPVATRVAQPKSAFSNSVAAKAAAPTRSSPKKTQTTLDLSKLSDDELLKLF